MSAWEELFLIEWLDVGIRIKSAVYQNCLGRLYDDMDAVRADMRNVKDVTNQWLDSIVKKEKA
jgi:hypothetical protein